VKLKFMEKTEALFKSKINNQILKNIKFYNTKEDYLAFDDEQQWIIQGGIEFIFEDTMISLGWNAEMHLYELIEGDLDKLLGEMDVYDIELDEFEEIEKLKGKQINDVSFNWTYYQKMDDEMELTDEKIYIPQEIILKFENEITLQVATILFHLKDDQISNPVYDPQGNILVSLDHIVEITEN
jgi:hypothetical protein